MRFPTPERLRRASLAVAFLACASFPAMAQGPVVVRAGSGTNVPVAPGGKLAVPFSVDLSAAQSTTVSFISLSVVFDQTKLVIDSIGFSGFLSDYGGGSNGNPLSLFMAGTTTGTIMPAGTIYFSALAGAGTTSL